MKKQTTIAKTKPLLAVAIMMKNEIKTIDRTIRSCANIANAVIILDTGSTDGTQELARKTAQKYKIFLHLFEEPFVNFGYSRNRLLTLARPYAHFLLLMDANEEIRNGHLLRPILKRNMRTDVFTIRLKIMNDAGLKGMETIFQRICIINSNNEALHYVGKIHEYITVEDDVTAKKLIDNQIFLQTEFHLFQDKEKDTLQAPRFRRDVVFLLEDLKEDPKNLRALFYLGTTYRNLKEHDLAFDAFSRRMKYAKEEHEKALLDAKESGKIYVEQYSDETYMTHMHAMELCMNCEKEESAIKLIFTSLLQYMSRHPTITRSEHFIIFAGYYLERKPMRYSDVMKAYQMAKRACEMPMPKDYRIVLKTNLYESTRWYLLAKSVHLLGRYDDILYMEAVSKLPMEAIQSLPPKHGIEYPTLPGPVAIQEMNLEMKQEPMEIRKETLMPAATLEQIPLSVLPSLLPPSLPSALPSVLPLATVLPQDHPLLPFFVPDTTKFALEPYV